jgi:hypothetical protein
MPIGLEFGAALSRIFVDFAKQALAVDCVESPAKKVLERKTKPCKLRFLSLYHPHHQFGRRQPARVNKDLS